MGVAGAGPPDPGDPAGFFCAEAPGEVLAVANGGVLGEPAAGFFVTGLESHAFIGAGLGAGAFVLLRVTAKHRHECKMRPVKRRHVYNVINKTQSRDL